MTDHNLIRQFDFFKSFEKPVNAKDVKKNAVFRNCIVPVYFLVSVGMVFLTGTSAYNKQSEIHQIMKVENKRITNNLEEFVIKSTTNDFVFKNYNQCTQLMKGTAESIMEQCNVYVLHKAQNAPDNLNLNLKAVYESLEELKKLTQYTPESTKKLNALFSDLGLPNQGE